MIGTERIFSNGAARLTRLQGEHVPPDDDLLRVHLTMEFKHGLMVLHVHGDLDEDTAKRGRNTKSDGAA